MAEGIEPNLRRLVTFAQLDERVAELTAFASGKKIHVTYPTGGDEVVRRARIATLADGLREVSGYYLIPQVVHPGVAARYKQPATEGVSAGDVWALADKRANDGDVQRRHVLLIDVDARRPSDVSADTTEKRASIEVAARVYGDLADLVGEDCLAIADSGNGWQVLIAVDLPSTDVVTKQAAGLLKALDALYSTGGAHVDTTTYNPARLIPLYGTMKAKGASTKERPHRRTWISTPPTIRRLREEEFAELVSTMQSRAPQVEARAKVIPISTARGGVVSNKPEWDDFWAAVRAIPVMHVLSWLGLVTAGGKPVCPGCGESDSGVVDMTSKGTSILKCSHSRCASRGIAEFGRSTAAGCYGPLEILLTARSDYGGDRWLAARALAEQFDINLPTQKRASKAKRPAPREDSADVVVTDHDTLEDVIAASGRVEASSEVVVQDATPWMAQLLKGRDGYKGNAHNIAVFLRHADGWRGRLAWDEFNNRVCWADGRSWTDVDATHLKIAMNTIRMDPQTADIRNVVQMVARDKTVHPVRDYLAGLSWDNMPRIDLMTSIYLGAEHSAYAATVGTWWMVQAVRRIFEPGASAKYILCLEGKQDIGKSTALRILCGDSWFSDSPWQVGTLAGQLGLAGIWIMELAEGSILRRADEAELKAAIGQRSDRCVPKYANEPVDVPRQVTFALSINPKNEGYLNDSTGNVRYWPIKCGTIDFDGLRRDRDQLWAEAVHLYREGLIPEPRTEAEKILLREVVAERETEDPWVERVRGAVRGQTQVTTAHVLTCLGVETARQTRRDQSRVAEILGGLGFRFARVRSGGGRTRAYVRDAVPEDELLADDAGGITLDDA